MEQGIWREIRSDRPRIRQRRRCLFVADNKITYCLVARVVQNEVLQRCVIPAKAGIHSPGTRGRASSADAADPRARWYRTGRAKSVRAPFVGGRILDARSRGHAKRIGPLPVSISIDLSPEPRNRAISSHMTTLDIAGLTPKERLDLIGELWIA